jgi:prepilin-type N-terminal cleavage/methylation domain-containing protein
MPARHAFTLLELLIVIGVLTLLMAPLTAVVRLAQKSGHRTQAQALLRRIDVAVHLFRDDVGAYPFQDHSAGSFDANHLGRQLTRTLTDGERSSLRSDLDQIGKAYAIGGSHALCNADVDPAASIYDPYKASNQTLITAIDREAGKQSHLAAVNRLAAERARLAILAGETTVMGIGANATKPVITATSVGWSDDYLSGDLAARERSADGESILDPQGEPVRYICPVTPGVRGFWPSMPMEAVHNGNVTIPVRVDYYGLGTISRRSVTTTMDSDRTDSAPARLIHEPELWSAGEDRVIGTRRNAVGNRDNVSAAPYDKDLQ